MDRMYCYLWSESDKPNECKFGERWVRDGRDPESDIWVRIKQSLGVRKDLIHDGVIQLNAFWDVSEYAQSVDRFYPQARVDDHIREQIGFRKYATGEIHTLPPDEMAARVNDVLRNSAQTLPNADLSQWQYDQAVNLIDSFNEGKRTVLAELCARFGKTIWTGAIAVELETQLTVVASYVLTSFASFKKDLGDFEQFRNLTIIDAACDDYQDQVQSALEAGQQVVVFLSMYRSPKRQERIDFLFAQDCTRSLFIDEADYGAHTKRQSDPFIAARKSDDLVVLMTGTNGERACGAWAIDHYLCTTYADLQIYKSELI